MKRFLRYVLPVLVAAVLAIVAVFVLNAFEVMHLMETEKRAGPTLLSR
jgi:ABC-type transport system involved in cytochrome bd biosynthesis fused ATPase/permease subunit